MTNWKINRVNEKLQNIAEVQAFEIFSALENKEISDSDARNILISAIRLAEMEIDYLSYMIETDQRWHDFAYSHLDYRKGRLARLAEYANELKVEWSNTDQVVQVGGEDNASSIKSSALSKIVWKGKKSDFARVYDALRPLLDCTKAEWERHFIDSKGGDMTKATDDHKGGNTRSSEIIALINIAKDMQPEVDN